MYLAGGLGDLIFYSLPTTAPVTLLWSRRVTRAQVLLQRVKRKGEPLRALPVSLNLKADGSQCFLKVSALVTEEGLTSA